MKKHYYNNIVEGDRTILGGVLIEESEVVKYIGLSLILHGSFIRDTFDGMI